MYLLGIATSSHEVAVHALVAMLLDHIILGHLLETCWRQLLMYGVDEIDGGARREILAALIFFNVEDFEKP